MFFGTHKQQNSDLYFELVEGGVFEICLPSFWQFLAPIARLLQLLSKRRLAV